MPKIEDFLEPLNKGVWEVTIPKESVTEPLSMEWKKSAINVPSPQTIASYRKGNYHIHETANEWKVHLDRYDPEEHPIMHLLDDAPILLMIGDTFMTLISDMKRNDSTDTTIILKKQDQEWHLQVFAGMFLALVGLNITSDPFGSFVGLTGLIIPLSIITLGIIISIFGLSHLKRETFFESDIPRGIIIIIAGIISFYLPTGIWVITLTAVLSFWMFASAILLLRRVKKGRSAVPEGFISRLIIGVISLLLVSITYFAPISLVTIFTLILGTLVILIGIMLTVNGLRLRNIMVKRTPDND